MLRDRKDRKVREEVKARYQLVRAETFGFQKALTVGGSQKHDDTGLRSQQHTSCIFSRASPESWGLLLQEQQLTCNLRFLHRRIKVATRLRFFFFWLALMWF